MNRKLFVMFCIPVFILNACASPLRQEPPRSHVPIRIGWQTTWATQGQITQVLANTNILELNDLQGSFVGVTYGAPLNEAALAGDVDVLLTADQPAATLLARSNDWVIIGRLMFNRVGIYVPPEAEIGNLIDLKGKKIAMPFGAAAQRVALKAIADAGLDPKKDITAINLDITEQAGIVASGTLSSWGDVDAMAGFDPTMAMFEVNHQARILYTGRVTSVIVMSKSYIESHPDAPEKFLKAFIEAVYYYAYQESRANEWFRRASQLTFDDEVLALSASVEPNLRAKKITDVSITLTPELISGMQEAADFIYANDLISKPIKMSDDIDQSYAQAAEQFFLSGNFDPNSVVVTDGK